MRDQQSAFVGERGAAHMESKGEGDVRVLVEGERASYGLANHRFVPPAACSVDPHFAAFVPERREGEDMELVHHACRSSSIVTKASTLSFGNFWEGWRDAQAAVQCVAYAPLRRESEHVPLRRRKVQLLSSRGRLEIPGECDASLETLS